MKIKWSSIWFGVFACLILCYFPYGGWMIAPLIGGTVAGYFSFPNLKQRLLSGVMVGFFGTILWCIISTIHWESWYEFIFKIGWISEGNFSQNSTPILLHITIFLIIYMFFGFIGGLIGNLIKFYLKKGE